MPFAFALAGWKEARVVIMGCPDEAGSRSPRRGSSQAPAHIRSVFNSREVFERSGVRHVAQPQYHRLSVAVDDIGDIRRSALSKAVAKAVEAGKIPVVMGGDHSLTAEALKGFDAAGRRLAVVYFDAHPDFICSSRGYYGSVVCDVLNYKNIVFSKSIEIGIRDAEPEELVNVRRKHLTTIYANDVVEMGVRAVLKKILARTGKLPLYASIDMDAVDPAFAPGVSTPVPGGLSGSEMVWLMKKLASRLCGFDVMEVTPRFDVQDMTSHLAGKIIIETLGAMK